MTDPRITLQEQIECAKREISMRKWVYPSRVNQGKMNQVKADHEIAAMEAILRTLEELAQREQG